MTAPGHIPPSNSRPFLSERDRKLLDRQFDIADPGSLPGLVFELPDNVEDDEIPEIEYKYDMTPPGGMKSGATPNILCAFAHGARHWSGYVVKFRNGSRARIGQHCGKNHFGFEFKKVESDFNADRSRKSDLIRLIEIRDAIPSLLSELHQFNSRLH